MQDARIVLVMAFMAACGGDDASDSGKIARCYVSSTVAPAAQSCIEFAPLDDAALKEALAACDESEAGVVKTWTEGAACASAGRIGQCTVVQSRIRSVTYVYATGSKDTDSFAREQAKESCLAGQHSEPPGAWTDLFES